MCSSQSLVCQGDCVAICAVRPPVFLAVSQRSCPAAPDSLGPLMPAWQQQDTSLLPRPGHGVCLCVLAQGVQCRDVADQLLLEHTHLGRRMNVTLLLIC